MSYKSETSRYAQNSRKAPQILIEVTLTMSYKIETSRYARNSSYRENNLQCLDDSFLSAFLRRVEFLFKVISFANSHA